MLWDRADVLVTSRLTYAEGRAALAAINRAGGFSPDRFLQAKREFDERFRELDQIEPTEAVCGFAGDVAERHGLWGYDAVHLASAMTLPLDELVFATSDRLLLQAATAEGISTGT
jgi:predicted nucleic acid-binding protein